MTKQADAQNARNLRAEYMNRISTFSTITGARPTFEERANQTNQLVEFIMTGDAGEQVLRKEAVDAEMNKPLTSFSTTFEAANHRFEFLKAAPDENDRSIRRTYIDQEGTLEAAIQRYEFIETGKV